MTSTFIMEPKKIVIAGGGFAGMNLALKLARNNNFSITLLDKNNYHFFPPLLYQVSTGFIEASNICYPFRKMFQHKENLRFYLGELKNIVPSDNRVETSDGYLSYDYLVLAMGTETNYFGILGCVKAILPQIRQDRKGCIINVTSVAGKIANTPLGPYAATKFALPE